MWRTSGDCTGARSVIVRSTPRSRIDALLERGELVGDEILDVIHDAILRDEFTEIDLREQRVD